MRRLGTIDLEVLILAIKENGTFNENSLENSELKRYGVGKILDTLASLKDRKFISLNRDGSFSITQLAREILWNSNIPLWARVLRLLQIKSCSLNEIIDSLQTPQDKTITEIEVLRKNQFILMSPQRKNEKLIKMYEILPEGIHKIDKTETDGFDEIEFTEIKQTKEISEMIKELIFKIENLEIPQNEKNNLIEKIINLKDKLKI
jgi:hypothetical protein